MSHMNEEQRRAPIEMNDGMGRKMEKEREREKLCINEMIHGV